MIALNSSRPGRRTLLILNSRGLVMLRWFNKSLSLPVGITVCLFLLDVTQGSVVLIIFIFGLIAFFFFLMIVVMVIVLR
jgi:hypothetical protein